LPVSNEISLPPVRWTVTVVASGFMIFLRSDEL
jgi:hypothetical protein